MDVKKSRQQRRRKAEAKATRTKEQVRQTPENVSLPRTITPPGVVVVPRVENGNEKRGSDQTKNNAAQNEKHQHLTRKAGGVTTFIGILLSVLVAISFLFWGIVVTNWGKPGHLWNNFWWGVAGYSLLGIAVFSGYYYFVIKRAGDAPASTLSNVIADAARSQAEWTAAQARARVSVDLQINGPITFDTRGAIVRFSLTLTNTGRSPASGMNIWPKVINEQNPYIRGEQRKICGLLPDGSNSPGSEKIFWGTTLFVGKPDAQDYALTVPPDELEHSKDFDGYFKGKIMLHILGCVDYAIDPSGQRHQTFFSYGVMTVDRSGNRGYVELDKDVPPSSIFVYKDITGWDAN
jgi:hypothetical protein